jgi:hypothetical protein
MIPATPGHTISGWRTSLRRPSEGSKPGDDFVEVLSAQLGVCDAMLAIIGPRWTRPSGYILLNIPTG